MSIFDLDQNKQKSKNAAKNEETSGNNEISNYVIEKLEEWAVLIRRTIKISD